jgi:hypothetical protein
MDERGGVASVYILKLKDGVKVEALRMDLGT